MEKSIQQLALTQMITGKRKRMINKIVLKFLKKIRMFALLVI